MRTYELFFQKRKWKGSVCFFLGIMLVFMRHPVIGIFVELFGAANLFRYGLAVHRARHLGQSC